MLRLCNCSVFYSVVYVVHDLVQLFSFSAAYVYFFQEIISCALPRNNSKDLLNLVYIDKK